ncbi:MAG: hypothetical protein KUG82_04775 [Pseudomonadales bacterium]|nr:hypothetical protein [Pseudomonadales bacterium]
MVLSELGILGITQVVLLFVGTTVFLLLYNRRIITKNKKLKTKIIETNEQANKMLAAARKTKEATPSSSPPSTDTSPSQFIDSALEETMVRYRSLGGDEMHLDATLSTELKSTALRYHYLMAEKNATEESGPNSHWDSLEPSIAVIFDKLQMPEVKGNDDQLNLLTTQVQELKEEQEAKTKESGTLQDAYLETMKNATNTYHSLIESSKPLPNQNELHNLLDSYHNLLIDFGSQLTGEEIDSVDSNLRMEHVQEEAQFESNTNDALSADDELSDTDTLETDTLETEIDNTETALSDIPAITRLNSLNEKQTQLIREIQAIIQDLEKDENGPKFSPQTISKIKEIEEAIYESTPLISEIETMLSTARESQIESEQTLPESDIDERVAKQIQTMVDQFSSESRQLIGTIRALELDIENHRTNQSPVDDQDSQEIPPNSEDSFLEKVGISKEQDTFSTNETQLPPTVNTETQVANSIEITKESPIATEFDPDELISSIEEGPDDPEALLEELIKENGLGTDNSNTQPGLT